MNTIKIFSKIKEATVPDGNPFKFHVLDDVTVYGSESTVIPVGFSFGVGNNWTLVVDSLRPDLIVIDYINLSDEFGIVVQGVEHVEVNLQKGEAFARGRLVETPLVKLRFAIFNEEKKRKIFGGVSKIENSDSKAKK
jgi:hypothetical protein